ncbi:hypothetical protein LTR37_017014 [Vermiconidia calcicola]|uniref:Uncharacterized protein n=1 Tax=Vermiconidia calcicola TaxID=1690605 RepID=A0ACC3MLZ0_9PEZI|nr:hypothetical protein LTR37_017014 [Vermiconidia calcicola]
MSTPTASGQAPQVQHSFDGDVKILNGTFDRRMEIRKVLASFQQELQRMETGPTQIKADIRLRVGGDEAREHVYTVSITSSDFDAESFARMVPSSGDISSGTAPVMSNVSASSPPAPRILNGQQATPAQHTSRPESRKATGEDDDVVEIRPFKRQRTGPEAASPAVAQRGIDPQSASGRVEQLYGFMKEWHGEWVRQGGWLFDNLNKANATTAANRAAIEKKMDAVQDVLGQSINAASASTLSEMSNVQKLIPWLEHCRKTSADKVQSREEKWRSSSATFHDQNRKEREVAEKRIEKKLEEQRELLVKLARVSGVDIDEVDGSGGSGSREQSLGAQLTAELNMEAAKAGTASRSDTGHEPINVDDN